MSILKSALFIKCILIVIITALGDHTIAPEVYIAIAVSNFTLNSIEFHYIVNLMLVGSREGVTMV